MKTQTCRQCLEDKPLNAFRISANGEGRRARRHKCKECEAEEQVERDSWSFGPAVKYVAHFETQGPEELWPKNRIFARAEFMACLDDGTWPLGLLVKDQAGKRYRVCLSLRRMK